RPAARHRRARSRGRARRRTRAGSRMRWTGVSVAVVGGDEREQEIARLAGETGADVRAYGFPWPQGGLDGVTLAASAQAALAGARFALFPIPGIGLDGALFAPAAPAPIVPDEQLLSSL